MTSEVFNEDCMAVMRRYPDKYFDLAVCDPPYAINRLQDQLFHLEYWGLDRKQVLKSAAGDRAAVKAMQKHCEKTIAELRAELKRVTEERDAAIKDRAELADFEMTVCEQFCFGDRKHDIPPCEWNRFGRCQLKEWRGLVAENATPESEVQTNDRP